MTEKDAYMNAIKASNNYNDCLLDIVEEQERGNEITKEMLQRSKEMRENEKQQINDLNYLLNDIVTALYKPDNINKFLSDKYMMKDKKTDEYYMINNLDIINAASSIKSEVEQLKDQLAEKETCVVYWRKEHDKLAQETNKLNGDIEAREGQFLRAIKRIGKHKATASKANAEKRLLMKIIGEGIEKVFEAQEILYLYQLELKQRRKKSKKGGKGE